MTGEPKPRCMGESSRVLVRSVNNGFVLTAWYPYLDGNEGEYSFEVIFPSAEGMILGVLDYLSEPPWLEGSE